MTHHVTSFISFQKFTNTCIMYAQLFNILKVYLLYNICACSRIPSFKWQVCFSLAVLVVGQVLALWKALLLGCIWLLRLKKVLFFQSLLGAASVELSLRSGNANLPFPNTGRSKKAQLEMTTAAEVVQHSRLSVLIFIRPEQMCIPSALLQSVQP